MDHLKIRAIVDAMKNGDSVDVESENQAEAREAFNAIVQALYQVNHLWTEIGGDPRAMTASTSSGGSLTVTVKPVATGRRSKTAASIG